MNKISWRTDITQDKYTFTIRQLINSWQFCYDEDLEEEYSGFINLLKRIIKERE